MIRVSLWLLPLLRNHALLVWGLNPQFSRVSNNWRRCRAEKSKSRTSEECQRFSDSFQNPKKVQYASDGYPSARGSEMSLLLLGSISVAFLSCLLYASLFCLFQLFLCLLLLHHNGKTNGFFFCLTLQPRDFGSRREHRRTRHSFRRRRNESCFVGWRGGLG